MDKHDRQTILDEISRNHALLVQVLEGQKSPYQRYMSELILNSRAISDRRHVPWQFKSLLEYGEEDFAKGGSFRVMYDITGEEVRGWHRQASLALGNEVTRSIIYEDEEGLVLFVRDGHDYRPARRGDAAYDFIKRLYADGNLSDISIDSPPSWATELFVSKCNLDAYACHWHDLDYLSEPGRDELKRLRREAVWRETLRLFGKAPYASETIPSPDQWGKEPEVPPLDAVLSAHDDLSSKERTNLRNIIGSLLAMLKHHGMGDAEVKKFLEEHRYSELPGLSRRNLESVFPLARKSIGER